MFEGGKSKRKFGRKRKKRFEGVSQKKTEQNGIGGEGVAFLLGCLAVWLLGGLNKHLMPRNTNSGGVQPS